MTPAELAEYERLVRRIRGYNDVWHSLRDGALGDDVDLSPAQRIARAAKGLLQVDLLRRFPALVYLVDDTKPGSPEPLFGVQLWRRVGRHDDACHLPVRVARENLTVDEIHAALARATLPPPPAGDPR